MPSLLDPVSPQAWTPDFARHLLNRAGFGIPAREAERLAGPGPEAAVARFVDFEKTKDPFGEPDFLPEPLDFAEFRRKVQGMAEEERRRFVNERQIEERKAVFALQDWWLDRMLTTLRPLQDKLALFWHGHFATSAQKVRPARFNWQLWRILREGAAGNFRELVRAVGKSSAMLEYLDNQQNRKGRPNENWAREVLELFTMGRGNYTENDIKEAARAFTGWTHVDERFWFNGRAHDDGAKTIFGKTAAYDGDQVVDLIAAQPPTSRFVARKLWEFFAYESPEEEIVDGLAGTLSDAGLELKPLLRRMFLSRAFYSERAVGTQVKSPVQLLLGLLDGLGVPLGEESGRFVRLVLTGLGQELFFPPNVKGWPGNRAWIDTNTLLLRMNLAGILVNGLDPEDFADGDGAKRRGLPRRIKAPFDAGRFVKRLGGAKTAPEAADRAGELLLGRRPAPAQRAVLAKAIETWSGRDGDVRALVHLVTSMAEYQLC
jgi:hypothetical protein